MSRNDELLKEIGLTLETMAGKINVALGPCNRERCCKYDITRLNNCIDGRGPCIYHEHENGRPLGCLAECHTSGCRLKDKLHPTCYAPEVCSLRTETAAEGWGPCNVPCDNMECMINREGNKCLNHGVCEDHIKPEPRETRGPCYNSGCEMHDDICRCHASDFCSSRQAYSPAELEQSTADTVTPAPLAALRGYTLEQWGQIRTGGYLCQFSQNGKPWDELGYFSEIDEQSLGDFIDRHGACWDNCRPAELPGVLRPWFGGDCPVPEGVRVIVRFADGGDDTTAAYNLKWEHLNEDGDIVAFMVLPE